jgi:hypothetical protein
MLCRPMDPMPRNAGIIWGACNSPAVQPRLGGCGVGIPTYRWLPSMPHMESTIGRRDDGVSNRAEVSNEIPDKNRSCPTKTAQRAWLVYLS